MNKLIGLTGGIASGKTVVSDYLLKRGYVVLDADKYARTVLDKGSHALKQVVDHFGTTILETDGTLNRSKLGNIIFNNEEERKFLNSVTHPEIRRQMNEDCRFYLKSGHVFQDIPLLFENGIESTFDKIIVVYVDETTQIKRLMKRNTLTKKEAVSRIRSQMSLDEKKKRADIVFDNSGTIESLYSQIDEFLKAL